MFRYHILEIVFYLNNANASIVTDIDLKTFHTFEQYIAGEIMPVERMANLGQKSIVCTRIVTPAKVIDTVSSQRWVDLKIKIKVACATHHVRVKLSEIHKYNGFFAETW